MFNIDLINNFKIISVFNLSWKANHTYAKARPFNALSLRVSGKADFFHGENIYNVNKGDIIFVPANYDYTIKSYKDEQVIVIHFETMHFKYDKIQVLTPPDTERFLELFQKIYRFWQHKPIGYEYRIYSIFYNIIENINIQTSYISSSPSINLQNVINYMNANFADANLSIQRLASRCNVSTTYFRRFFSQSLSQSPIEYLTNLRIAHATSLLKSGYYSIEEVAFNSGFNDSKYFSTLYKKKCGISPSKVKNTDNSFE